MKPIIAKATMRVPQFSQPASPDDPGLSLQQQTDALFALVQLPVREAIGAACSYLLYAAENHPAQLRRVMNEKVVKRGFTGESLLDVIKRASR